MVSEAGHQRTPYILPITIYGGSDCTPKSLDASITTVYNDPVSGQPRVANCVFSLPLGLCGNIVPPKKVSTHKVTIETNKPPIPIANLFDDLIARDDVETNNMIGDNIFTFQYANGKDATLLISKNAGKYRIQSGSLECLYLLTKEIARRVKECSSALHSDGAPIKIEFTENLPFYPYFDLIDEHFKHRKGLQIYYEQLDKLAHQFRVIQKRLLVRYKDKNPTSINGLDILHESTYEEILTLSKKVEKTQVSLKELSHSLSCATSLMHFLIRLNLSLEDAEMEVLENHWVSQVSDDTPGWEETLDFGLGQLLSTILTKKPKEKGTQQTISPIEDTARVKKRIALVFDKLHNFKLIPGEKEEKRTNK